MHRRPVTSLLVAATLMMVAPGAAGAQARDGEAASASAGTVAGSSAVGSARLVGARIAAEGTRLGGGATADPSDSSSAVDGVAEVAVDLGASSPRIDWRARVAALAGSCPEPTVTVSDADQLHAALADAGPGTVIALQDGVYQGRFAITAAASASDRAWLCGGPGAVLDAGSPTKGYVLHLDDADHWVVQGFGVRNGMKGVMADGVQGVTLRALHVRDTGDEAIHLRRFSTDNLVVGNTITRTGLREPKFGEGVYIGTATSNWCSITDCEPDRSDRNRVVDNWIHGTTAEPIDIKEGTSDGLVEGNRFDGSALTGADSWVDVKGNDWLITGNHGEHTPRDGFQTHNVAAGWGTANHFAGNTGLVDDEGGLLVALRPVLANTVACTNQLLGTVGGLSNVTCR